MYRQAIKDIDFITVIILTLAVVVLLLNYSGIPGTVAVHFEIDGTPDSFAGRWAAWIPIAIAIAIAVGLTLLRIHPEKLNIPIKISDENREDAFAMVQLLLSIINLEVVALFSFISLSMTGIISFTLWIFYPLIAIIIISPVVAFHRLSNLNPRR
jgi:hypothetical protein